MIKKISVPDIMCSACTKRISNALKENKIDFTISLEEKTVTINGCEKCFNTAISVIEDLGFTPKEI